MTRSELRESLAEELVDRYGEPENQELFEKMLDSLDHLIDEYVAGVKKQKVKQAKSLCGCPMCEHHSTAYTEQRRRAGIGGDNNG